MRVSLQPWSRDLPEWSSRTEGPLGGHALRRVFEEVFSPETVAYVSRKVNEALSRHANPSDTRKRLEANLVNAQAQLENIKAAKSLLGATPRPVRAYNSNGLGLMTPESAADEGVELLAGGFQAVKPPARVPDACR